MTNLRRQVLTSFKKLHRARQIVFKDDDYTLDAVRKTINEEFRKHKEVSAPEQIQKLVNIARTAEVELRTCIVQAKEVEPGKYRLRLRPENLQDNVTPGSRPRKK